MLQNKPLWKVFQAQEIPGDGEQPGQCQFIKGHILLDANCQGQRLCGRGDTIGTIHLDSSKAFTGVNHSSLTEDTNYWVDEEPRIHWAQNTLWLKLNYQVVPSDIPQSPELGQNMLNILLNRREPSQGHWFVHPGEEEA
ncbi:hypothetical protein HGM15179_010957 [Zosterops borbonicus]|uniref:Uncharacterized protein n=1 Tax=Zosterops borbonicus TaxID=364589 RepID=A0A8K1LJH9_9PASS|nr:hypothetical protein HGM15179_010957 [Zosterops borbonicus]